MNAFIAVQDFWDNVEKKEVKKDDIIYIDDDARVKDLVPKYAVELPGQEVMPVQEDTEYTAPRSRGRRES